LSGGTRNADRPIDDYRLLKAPPSGKKKNQEVKKKSGVKTGSGAHLHTHYSKSTKHKAGSREKSKQEVYVLLWD